MKITIEDKHFECVISYDQIKKRARLLGVQLSVVFEHRNPLFIGVLNGCFMFFGDLMKQISIPCEVSFVKFSSYEGDQRADQVTQLLGLDADLKDRDVVIVEDIVDSGNTLRKTLDLIYEHNPASVTVCTLLLKPDVVEHEFEDLEYVGFEIPDDFVVGYGLDYKGKGRNLPDIYSEIS